MSGPAVVPVTGPQPYQVVIGHGVLGRLRDLPAGASAVAVVHPVGLAELAGRVAAPLAESGAAVHLLPVPDGEPAKDLSVAGALWRQLAELRVARTDLLVGVGGGATTDLTGFVAANWLRGVRVAFVPTTLLGMVDAAIGGKTAVNIEAGKNLVGSFHSPAGVVCDLDMLRTLPAAEYASGLAEVVKTGFVADPAILDLLEADPDGARRADGPHTDELVRRSVAVKSAVVGEDFRDLGRRQMLNYGHTLGHAIEQVENYSGRHGAAVSVGLVYAAALGRLAGRLAFDVAERHRTLLAALGLPVSYPAAAWPRLREAMQLDKKARGHRLRFVVLDGLARPGILDDPDPDLLGEAYAEVAT